jgi:hypothetical protein
MLYAPRTGNQLDGEGVPVLGTIWLGAGAPQHARNAAGEADDPPLGGA